MLSFKKENQEENANGTFENAGGPGISPLFDHSGQMAVPEGSSIQMKGNDSMSDGPMHIKASASNGMVQRNEETDEETREDSTDEIDAELDELINGIEAPAPNIPPFEVITVTTGAETSRGELERDIERLWTRERMSFTEAARHAAAENTSARSGPIATQSQQIEPETPYSKRWSLGLYVYDYNTGSDLSKINLLTRRGSPFQRSLAAEFDNVITVRNPTGEGITSEIYGAIHNLWLTLESGQIGELVVSFSGHGGNGAISGRDSKGANASQLAQIADFAEEFDVHIIYILDTCRAGTLVNFAHRDATTDLTERIPNAPADQQAELTAQLEVAEKLGSLSARISSYAALIGWASRTYRRQRNDENFLALFDQQSELFNQIKSLRDFLSENIHGEHPVSTNAELRQQISDLMMSILISYGGSRSLVNASLRDAAELLDNLNDTVNGIIVNLNTQIPATAQQTPAAQ